MISGFTQCNNCTIASHNKNLSSKLLSFFEFTVQLITLLPCRHGRYRDSQEKAERFTDDLQSWCNLHLLYTYSGPYVTTGGTHQALNVQPVVQQLKHHLFILQFNYVMQTWDYVTDPPYLTVLRTRKAGQGPENNGMIVLSLFNVHLSYKYSDVGFNSKLILAGLQLLLGETQSQAMHLIPALPVLVICKSCLWCKWRYQREYYTV